MVAEALAFLLRGLYSTGGWEVQEGSAKFRDRLSTVDPKTNVAIDRQMRSPYSDQISASLDRDLSSRVTASVSYVRKNGTDLIGWRDTGGVYKETTSTLLDLRPFPTFNLVNSPDDRRFLLTNPVWSKISNTLKS